MASNPLGINLGTQAYVNFDITGTVNTQVIDVRQGTVTLSNPTGTTVQFNNGTVNLLGAGTITRLEGGTLGLITRVGNIGTLEVGTISSIPQVSVGTIPNIPGGTINIVAAGTLTRLADGTIRIPAGTITSVSNLAQGTITSVQGGSIAITAGTVRLNPQMTQTIQGAGTTTSGTVGTLVAAGGVGVGIYVTSFNIIAHSGTPDVVLAFGTAEVGNTVYTRGKHQSPGGGIGMPLPIPSNKNTTNSPLTWKQMGDAGTISISVDYFTA